MADRPDSLCARALFQRTWLVGLGAVVASCGGGSSSSDPATGGPGPGTADLLTLAGTPLATVVAGTRYCFSPDIDYDGSGALRFSVSGLPAWASYDAATGDVYGAPTVGDVGTHSGIRITATDGSEQEVLGPFSIEVVGTAQGSAELAWAAPTERTDGSPLTDLAGFNLYWGPAADSLCNSVTIANPSIDTFLIEGLTPAAWHFAATAFDTTGIESGRTASVSKTISQ